MTDPSKDSQKISSEIPVATNTEHSTSRTPRWLSRIDWGYVVAIIGGLVFLFCAGYLIWSAVELLSWQTSVAIAAALLLVTIVTSGYLLKWKWTGFTDYRISKAENEEFQRSKTLWDWLQLLFIPTVLAVAALMFNARSARVDREIAAETQRETILQSYIDKMSELLLDKKLRQPGSGSEARNLAQTRTLSVLRRLDGERRGIVLQFLKASELIKRPGDQMIDLTYADLSNTLLTLADMREVDLSNTRLNYADLGSTNFERSWLIGTDFSHARVALAVFSKGNLRGAKFEDARLTSADFVETDLSWARLKNADASYADFTGANLSNTDLENTNLEQAKLENANLKDAKVTTAQLAKCSTLKGATMPDGSKHN